MNPFDKLRVHAVLRPFDKLMVVPSAVEGRQAQHSSKHGERSRTKRPKGVEV